MEPDFTVAENLKAELWAFHNLLGRLRNDSLFGLSVLVNLIFKSKVDIQYLEDFLLRVPNEALLGLIGEAEKNFIRQRNQNIQKELAQFDLFYFLYLISQIFYSFQDLNLLLTFMDLLPELTQAVQIRFWESLQLFFTSENVGFVTSRYILQIQRGSQLGGVEAMDQVARLLSDPQKFPHFIFPFFQKLTQVLSLDNIGFIFNQMQKYSPVQFLLLLGLKQFLPFVLKDSFEILCPRLANQQLNEFTLNSKLEFQQPTAISDFNNNDDVVVEKGDDLRVEITTEPPEHIIYKRNITPFPTVEIIGNLHHRNHDVEYYVQPKLIKCDTQEEHPELFDGKSVKVESNRTILFSKLKVSETSKKGDSLYYIKFLLLAYDGVNTNILHSVSSRPFTVYSHINQINKIIGITHGLVPILKEIIPQSGPSIGGSKVVIIGKNFVDSSTLRVKFDNTVVVGKLHGPKTLVCLLPAHIPKIATVSVANESNVWSNSVQYTFYDTPGLEKSYSAPQQQQQFSYFTMNPNPYNFGHISSTLFVPNNGQKFPFKNDPINSFAVPNSNLNYLALPNNENNISGELDLTASTVGDFVGFNFGDSRMNFHNDGNNASSSRDAGDIGNFLNF